MRTRQFGDLPEQLTGFDAAKVVILPVPFEADGTWVKGTDKGPEALLEASANMELYDVISDREIHRIGIHTAEAAREHKSPDKMVKEVETRVMQLLKKRKLPVLIGGDQSVSIGAIKACSDYYKEKDFSVVQFGAHACLKPECEHSRNGHGCVMARAAEISPIVQIGIRSMSMQDREVVQPDRIFYAHNIADVGNKTWMYDLLNKLTKNSYLTFNLDVFDPSVMGSVSNPEPGGLFWYQVLEILQKVNEKSNIVGFDVVGLVPMKYNKAPNLLAARLVYQMLSYRFGTGTK